MNKLSYIFVFCLFINFSYAQEGMKALSCREYLQTLNELELNSNTCYTLKYSSYAYPGTSVPYETAKGVLLNSKSSSYYSVFGSITTIESKGVIIGIDSVLQDVYLRWESSKTTRQFDFSKLDLTKIDTTSINKILILHQGNRWQIKLDLNEKSGIETVQIWVNNQAIEKYAVQYPWIDFSPDNKSQETYHPYLEVELSPIVNCGSYDYLYDISNYLKPLESGRYTLAPKYSNFKLTDLRYIQPKD